MRESDFEHLAASSQADTMEHVAPEDFVLTGKCSGGRNLRFDTRSHGIPLPTDDAALASDSGGIAVYTITPKGDLEDAKAFDSSADLDGQTPDRLLAESLEPRLSIRERVRLVTHFHRSWP